MDADRLAHFVRLSEDALRAAALFAAPDEADLLTDRAGERASQVEQLRALERPHGATAAALPPAPHAFQSMTEAEHALAAACRDALAEESLDPAFRVVLERIVASCR